MKRLYSLITVISLFSFSYGQSWLGAYQGVLDSYVTSKGVKYKKLKSKDAATIDQVTAAIAAEKPSGSDADKLAYYLNAYNAWMLKIALDRYPIDSILSGDDKIFERKLIKVGGKTMSLNDLEHNVIRKKFGDARIHFAVNCASESCPPLSKTAFTGENLNNELHKLTTAFINSKYGVSQKGEALHVSKLFEWYAKDFKKDSKDGSVLGYIKQYKKVSGSPALQYAEYSWKLNEN